MAEAHERLIRKLQSITELSGADREALRQLPLSVRSIERGRAIAAEGDRRTDCCMVLDGIVCTHKLTAEGERQITSFYISGDVPDLQNLHLGVLDHGITALTRATLAFIPHPAMADAAARYPGIAKAFWRDTLVDSAVYREWVVNVGRRIGATRLAHVFCEMYARNRAVGLGRELQFDLPLTQGELGDAIGLSSVHTNRVLQELRSERLVQFERGVVAIPDLRALEAAGDFHPQYLHLREDVPSEGYA